MRTTLDIDEWVQRSELFPLRYAQGAVCVDMHIVRSPEQFSAMMSELLASPEVCYDTETDGLNPRAGKRICGHALSRRVNPNRVRAWYVPVRHVGAENQLDPFKVASGVGDLLQKVGGFLGHNLKFDAKMLRADLEDAGLPHGWLRDVRWDDTFLMSHLFDENQFSFSLKNLSAAHVTQCAKDSEGDLEAWMKWDAKSLGIPYSKSKSSMELSYRERFGYARSPVYLCARYACFDVTYPWFLLDKFGVVRSAYPEAYNRDNRVAKILADIEWVGLPVDVAEVMRAERLLAAEVAHCRQQLEAIVRSKAGIGSFAPTDNQMRRLLYGNLGMHPPKLTDSQQDSVDKESRELLARQYPQHADLMYWLNADARATKLWSTYAVGFRKHITSEDRIHPSYNQIERREKGGPPVTGRLSSQEPNQQNVAKEPLKLQHTNEEIMIHRFYVVAPGEVRAMLDFSQIELRTLAWLSQDPVLLDCYANDRDVHAITAREVTGGSRKLAKQVNFGSTYGLGARGFARRMPGYYDDPEGTTDLAQQLLSRFFETYAGVPVFRESLAAHMRDHRGRFVSPFNRPRRIPDICNDHDRRAYSRALRQMMSSIVSGTAADLMKETMIRCDSWIRSEGLPARETGTIHDEIMFDMPINGCGRTIEGLHRLFVDWPTFSERSVPIRASIEVTTTSWAEKKAVKLRSSVRNAA